LGYIYQHLGDLAQAQAHYEQAIEAYREIGAPVGEAHSLTGLGDVLGLEDGSRAAQVTARGQHRVGRVAPSAARLLAVVAGMLPAGDRDRYAEEYRSELWEIAHAGQPRRRQLHYAFRQVVSFPRLCAELRVPRRRGAAP
jgi:tetratricopeptide (TPR) repeat protein